MTDPQQIDAPDRRTSATNAYRHDVNVGGTCFPVAVSAVYPDLAGDGVPWLYIETDEPISLALACRAVWLRDWPRPCEEAPRGCFAWLFPRHGDDGVLDWIVPGDAAWMRGHTSGDRYVPKGEQSAQPITFSIEPVRGRQVMGAIEWAGRLRPCYADRSRIGVQFQPGLGGPVEDAAADRLNELAYRIEPGLDADGILWIRDLAVWHRLCKQGLAIVVSRVSGWITRQAPDAPRPLYGDTSTRRSRQRGEVAA